jgi:hypothetical protein
VSFVIAHFIRFTIHVYEAYQSSSMKVSEERQMTKQPFLMTHEFFPLTPV